MYSLACGLSDNCSLMPQNNPRLLNTISDSFTRCVKRVNLKRTKKNRTQLKKKFFVCNSIAICELYSAIKKLAPYQMKVCPSTWCSTPTQAIVKAAIL